MPTFTNQAQLTYNGITTNSNIATGEIIEVLTANKAAILDEYTSGGMVTYVINLVNAGTIPYMNLTITDNLGAYQYTPATGAAITLYPLDYVPGSIHYFQNGIEQPDPAVTTTNGLTITGISVPADGITTILYQATTNEYTPLTPGSSITNTALISGGCLGTRLEVSDTVTVRNAPVLSIFKSITPRQVQANGQVTYTFDIQNRGNTGTTVADNVRVFDLFNPTLTDITVYYNGAILPVGSYTYNEITGEFATNPGVINVPAATYTQDPATGERITDPGDVTLVVIGTI